MRLHIFYTCVRAGTHKQSDAMVSCKASDRKSNEFGFERALGQTTGTTSIKQNLSNKTFILDNAYPDDRCVGV